VDKGITDLNDNGAVDFERNELKNRRVTFAVFGINNFIEEALPLVLQYTSIAVFIYATNLTLLPDYVVLIVAYYQTLSQTLGLEFMRGITWGTAGRIALNRVQVILTIF
jgi:hypothetical protein